MLKSCARMGLPVPAVLEEMLDRALALIDRTAEADEDAGNSDEGEQDSEPLDHLARVATANGPLRLRESPRTGTVLTNMPKGSILEVLGDGDWPKVRFAGLTGYASAEYLQRISCKG